MKEAKTLKQAMSVFHLKPKKCEHKTDLQKLCQFVIFTNVVSWLFTKWQQCLVSYKLPEAFGVCRRFFFSSKEINVCLHLIFKLAS